MSQENEDGGEEVSAGTKGEVVFLLRKLQEQLTFLERKVDTLLNQSKEAGRAKPAYDAPRGYSKPAFRPRREERYEERPPRREGRYEGPRESRPARSSGGHGYAPGSGFAGKKKPFFKK